MTCLKKINIYSHALADIQIFVSNQDVPGDDRINVAFAAIRRIKSGIGETDAKEIPTDIAMAEQEQNCRAKADHRTCKHQHEIGDSHAALACPLAFSGTLAAMFRVQDSRNCGRRSTERDSNARSRRDVPRSRLTGVIAKFESCFENRNIEALRLLPAIEISKQSWRINCD